MKVEELQQLQKNIETNEKGVQIIRNGEHTHKNQVEWICEKKHTGSSYCKTNAQIHDVDYINETCRIMMTPKLAARLLAKESDNSTKSNSDGSASASHSKPTVLHKVSYLIIFKRLFVYFEYCAFYFSEIRCQQKE